MSLLTIQCSFCQKEFLRNIRQIRENNKLGHKNFCSTQCLRLNRLRQVTCICENPKCKKEFIKLESALSPHNYCSRSCTATINNTRFPKNPGKRKSCLSCSKTFVSKEKYCSVKCKYEGLSISKDILLEKIRDFYNTYTRIPLKTEFIHASAARKRFGSWNNAIKAAGFDPNPLLFAKKHIANDGHKCDSLAEKIIDDWLYARKIPHKRSVPYGKDNMTADFKINNIFIEFFGLHGQLKKYDLLLERKKILWREKSLKVIEIYPKDLFPKNKLEQILKSLL